MTTSNPTPIPTAAPRGAVQKTFVPTTILSGFTDVGHFSLLAGEYLATLNEPDRNAILAEADRTRAHVATLPALAAGSPVLGDITHAHVDAIRADPLFAQAFGHIPHKFCYVDPFGLVALQATIEPRSDTVPTDEAQLLEFALPRTWDVPAEVSLIPPSGPIQIVSSSPAMQGLAIELDPVSGKVMLSPPKNLNLVQVVHFHNRYYLRNGYHRVADAVRSGCRMFPAIVLDGLAPEQIGLPGAAIFHIGYVSSRPRPPMVQDFYSPASLSTKTRERRYGFIVNLDIKPINVGV